MPYCCQCGQKVGDADTYCSICGTRQPQKPLPATDFLGSMSPRTASLLCYVPVIGWIFAIVVLASHAFRSDPRVRFNAFQGLYLFVAWLLVDWVLAPMFLVTHFWAPESLSKLFPALLKAGLFFAWIFMIIKSAQDQTYKLPILGDLAQKSVSEQR